MGSPYSTQTYILHRWHIRHLWISVELLREKYNLVSIWFLPCHRIKLVLALLNLAHLVCVLSRFHEELADRALRTQGCQLCSRSFQERPWLHASPTTRSGNTRTKGFIMEVKKREMFQTQRLLNILPSLHYSLVVALAMFTNVFDANKAFSDLHLHLVI